MSHPHRLQLCWRSSTIELGTEQLELRDALGHIYGPFVTHQTDAGSSSPRGRPDGWQASIDGDEFRYADFADAVVELEFELETRLFAGPDHPILHAAAVTDGDCTVILAGPSGAGKTTAALECARRGFRYLADEFTALDATGAVLHPFPRAATLKQSWPVVPSGHLYEVQADWGYRGWYLPDHRSDLREVPLASPWLIFLERQAGTPARARRLTHADALTKLICSTFEFVGREEVVWPAISNLAVRSRSCELVYSDMDPDLGVALALLEGA